MAEKDIAAELIATLSEGEFKKLGKVNPSGSLEVRKLSSGAVQFYWRITIGTKGRREPIGLYDSSAPPKSLQPTGRGYSIKAAFRAAEGFALKHHANKESGERRPHHTAEGDVDPDSGRKTKRRPRRGPAG